MMHRFCWKFHSPPCLEQEIIMVIVIMITCNSFKDLLEEESYQS